MDFIEFTRRANMICEENDMRFCLRSTSDINSMLYYAKKPHPLGGESYISSMYSVDIDSENLDILEVYECVYEIQNKLVNSKTAESHAY